MTQAIQFTIPVHSKWVPNCMERLIDKQIGGVALSTLEKLIDWVMKRLYCPYQTLYKEKMGRIHYFSDKEAQLFDCTTDRIAGIRHPKEGVPPCDFITLREKKVYFHQNPRILTIFSKKAFTDYMIVKDAPERGAGWCKITEHETVRPEADKPEIHEWFVDTATHNRLVVDIGQIRICGEQVYLVENAPKMELDNLEAKPA